MSNKIKFISNTPKLAIALHNRKRLIMPEELHQFLNAWIFDVGKVMRQREFLVSSLANYVSSAIIEKLL